VLTARIVLFGDTHLGFDLPAKPRTDRRLRGEDFFANFRRVLDYAVETRADALVHGGDVFDTSRVHRSIAERAFEALHQVAEGGIPVVIVPGNHDRSRLPPSLWLGHPNIQVFHRPGTVTLSLRGMRVAFAGFPFAWGDLRQSFGEIVRCTGVEAAEADARFLCMHHTVAGASVGPNGYTFRSGSDVIPRGSLPGSLAGVLSGHIHRHQVLEGAHPPVFYPGSIERTSFAEQDERKGFLELTVRKRGRAAGVEGARFIELPARPMVKLPVPAGLPPGELRTFLARAAASLATDSVVRVEPPENDAGPPEELTAALLRSTFPPSMNVEVRRRFVRGER